MNFDWLIISTPERDAVAGKNDYGPPRIPRIIANGMWQNLLNMLASGLN